MKKVILILLSALLCLSAAAQDLTPKQNSQKPQHHNPRNAGRSARRDNARGR